MKLDDANPLAVIAGAGMGWKPVYEAKTFWHGKPCRACERFEMRMVRAQESDTFGHLWPTCNHPALPGEHGQPTQVTATCDRWSPRPGEASQ